MSNDDLLDDLRKKTSALFEATRGIPDDRIADLASEVLNAFVSLDLSLLEGGQLPGAWGASKLSKSKM